LRPSAKRIVSIIWKTPVIAVALVVGLLGASQTGWSGAEVAVNAPIMGAVETLATFLIFLISVSVSIGVLILIYRLAKHTLWLAAPVLLYMVFLPGVWNGIASDFDATRVRVINAGYANGFALENMKPVGRYWTCNDPRIELAEDAKPLCVQALAAGEPIAGGRH
jgi:hypothetical protein